MADATAEYPATLEIDYPDRELDRLTTLVRPITVIPIAVILSLVTGPSPDAHSGSGSPHHVLAAGGFVSAATALMLVFRQKYPRWWFYWNLALARFATRVAGYLALLRDEYPSTDDEQAVHLDIPYPDAARDLNRWLPIVKWLLAIPHYIALAFVAVAAIVCVIVAWFAMPESKRGAGEAGQGMEWKNMAKTRIERHGFAGTAWFAGWLFTLGFLHLSFWKGVLAILVWPYYLGAMFALPHP